MDRSEKEGKDDNVGRGGSLAKGGREVVVA